MIPQFLLSTCADRMAVELCRGCEEAVKQNQTSGRWFITMGHPGFNLPQNNGRGFKTRRWATLAMERCAGR